MKGLDSSWELRSKGQIWKAKTNPQIPKVQHAEWAISDKMTYFIYLPALRSIKIWGPMSRFFVFFLRLPTSEIHLNNSFIPLPLSPQTFLIILSKGLWSHSTFSLLKCTWQLVTIPVQLHSRFWNESNMTLPPPITKM